MKMTVKDSVNQEDEATSLASGTQKLFIPSPSLLAPPSTMPGQLQTKGSREITGNSPEEKTQFHSEWFWERKGFLPPPPPTFTPLSYTLHAG